MTPFERALRDELMAAARRPPRKRLPRTALAAIAAVAAITLVIGVSVTGDPTPAGADVEVTRADGRVIVRLTDQANRPEEIQAALEPEGLDIRVAGAPVGPSNVGRFVGQIATAADLVDLEHIRVDGVTFMGFSLPEGWDGTLTLLVGRPAAPGETYEAASNAFAPGEPLACTDTLGDPLRDVAARLDDYTVAVLDYTRSGAAPRLDLAEALTHGLGDQSISGAVLVSADEVVVFVGRHAPPAEAPEC